MSRLLKQFQDEMLQWKTLKKKPDVFGSRLGISEMAIFSSNYSLEFYLPQFLGPCDFFLILFDKCFPKEKFTA